MATLSQATAATRTFLRWAGIAFAVFLIIRIIIFPLGMAIYGRLFPKEAPPPTVAFGILSKIAFPSSQRVEASFVVQTTTGTLAPTCLVNTCVTNEDPTNPVNIPDRLIVYKVLREPANFSSYDRAKDRVRALGFTEEGVALSDIVYQWRHPRMENRQITFNIVTNTFTLTTTIASPSADSPRENLPQKEEAIRKVKTFLSSLDLLPKDIDESKTAITFLKLTEGQFKKTTSLSESDLVQVDLYKKSLSGLPIVYPNPSQSLMSFGIQGNRNPEFSIAQAQFSYKAVDIEDENKSSTYPIKSAQAAFEELQRGQGFLVSGPATGSGQIAIQKVYLAYYEDAQPGEFLQPVFVFEGDRNFRAYVSAVTNEWRQ